MQHDRDLTQVASNSEKLPPCTVSLSAELRAKFSGNDQPGKGLGSIFRKMEVKLRWMCITGIFFGWKLIFINDALDSKS